MILNRKYIFLVERAILTNNLNITFLINVQYYLVITIVFLTNLHFQTSYLTKVTC